LACQIRHGRAVEARGGAWQSQRHKKGHRRGRRARAGPDARPRCDPPTARQGTLGGRPRAVAPQPDSRVMVIVDTTVWIDYLQGTNNPESDWLGRESTRQRLGLTDLILCEILQGIRNPASFVQVRNDLLRFEVLPAGGGTLGIAAGWTYRELGRRGQAVRQCVDGRIAPLP